MLPFSNNLSFTMFSRHKLANTEMTKALIPLVPASKLQADCEQRGQGYKPSGSVSVVLCCTLPMPQTILCLINHWSSQRCSFQIGFTVLSSRDRRFLQGNYNNISARLSKVKNNKMLVVGSRFSSVVRVCSPYLKHTVFVWALWVWIQLI